MQRRIVLSCFVLAVVLFIVERSVVEASAYARPDNPYSRQDEEDTDKLMEFFEGSKLFQDFLRNRELENSKRGMDLGLHRGFSGLQSAKHLLGLAAANYAGGPGRRRRSEQP